MENYKRFESGSLDNDNSTVDLVCFLDASLYIVDIRNYLECSFLPL